jgi:hypothetical protein
VRKAVAPGHGPHQRCITGDEGIPRLLVTPPRGADQSREFRFGGHASMLERCDHCDR